MLRMAVASRLARSEFNDASPEQIEQESQKLIEDYRTFLRLGFDDEEACIYLRRGIKPPPQYEQIDYAVLDALHYRR